MRKILVNTVRVGQVTHAAGSSFDAVHDAATITAIEVAGGKVVNETPPLVRAAAIVAAMRQRGGSGGGGEPSIDALMLAQAGGSGGGAVNWRPSGGGNAETWDDVMAAIEASNAPVDVWCTEFGSPGYVIPARATPYDMKGARIVAVLGNASGNIVTISQGAVLRDLATVEGGVALAGTATSGGPCLTFTEPGGGSPAAIGAVNGAIIANFGTEPMIRIGPMSGGVVIAAIRGSSIGIGPGGPPSGPVAFLEVGANVITAAVAGATWADGWLVNDGVDTLANCFFQNDGNLRAPPPANPGFAGSTFNIPFGNYGGAGPTAFRPATVFGPLSVGVQYFDTDLGFPIWWNGTAWAPMPRVLPADPPAPVEDESWFLYTAATGGDTLVGAYPIAGGAGNLNISVGPPSTPADWALFGTVGGGYTLSFTHAPSTDPLVAFNPQPFALIIALADDPGDPLQSMATWAEVRDAINVWAAANMTPGVPAIASLTNIADEPLRCTFYSSASLFVPSTPEAMAWKVRKNARTWSTSLF